MSVTGVRCNAIMPGGVITNIANKMGNVDMAGLQPFREGAGTLRNRSTRSRLQQLRYSLRPTIPDS